MDTYFDIKAIPNPEIIQSEVVSYVMQSLHYMLPQYDGRIGLSFPAYSQKRGIGGIIRVLGEQQDIECFHTDVYLNNTIQDYALITEQADIPKSIKEFAIFKRKHMKGNSDFNRLRKRHIQKGTWTDELANAIAKKYNQFKWLPHIHLKSESTKQSKITLFIEKKNKKEAETGLFNAYGLSIDGATVPIF